MCVRECVCGCVCVCACVNACLSVLVLLDVPWMREARVPFRVVLRSLPLPVVLPCALYVCLCMRWLGSAAVRHRRLAEQGRPCRARCRGATAARYHAPTGYRAAPGGTPRVLTACPRAKHALPCWCSGANTALSQRSALSGNNGPCYPATTVRVIRQQRSALSRKTVRRIRK